MLSADLKRALAAPRLGRRIRSCVRAIEIIVFNLSASRARIIEPIIRDLELQATPDKPEQVVSIDGRVKAPGKYPLEPTMHVSDLIRAGGSLEDAAFRGQAELTRYAVVDGDARHTELINVDLAAIRRGTMPAPTWSSSPTTRWSSSRSRCGWSRAPSRWPARCDSPANTRFIRARPCIRCCCGPEDSPTSAFPEGAVFIREELKKREKEQLELLANRLQSDLAALSLEAVASSAAVASGGQRSAARARGLRRRPAAARAAARYQAGRPAGHQCRGRLNGRPGGPDDVVVEDGDKLMMPKKTQDVTILGEVQSPTSHVYQPGL